MLERGERRVSRAGGRWLVGALVITMAALGAATATAQVNAGVDCWTTDPATTTISVPALPAGFFGLLNGVPSDPFPAQVVAMQGVPLPPGTCPCQNETDLVWVDIHGNPVDPGDIHAVTQVQDPNGTYDTCVERLDTATFPGGIGVADTVQIEIIALDLVSVNDLLINYGVQGPLRWNVQVRLDGPQNIGALDLTPLQLVPPAGDMVLPDLPVTYRIDFGLLGLPARTPEGFEPPDKALVEMPPRKITVPSLSISLANTAGTFGTLLPPPPVPLTEIPTLSEWGLVLFALVLVALAVMMISRRRTRSG